MAKDPEHIDFPGKIFPMTVITAITPWKKWALKPLLRLFARQRLLEVEQLRFIHFARWTPIEKVYFTRGRPDHQTRTPNRSYYLFSTNFNGPWDQYIDSFSLVGAVQRGMDWLWGTSDKFPKAYPIRRFKRYIRYHEYPVDAYYTAYPNATIRDIESALIVEQQVALLAAQVATMVPLDSTVLPSTSTSSFPTGILNMLAPNLLAIISRRAGASRIIDNAVNVSFDPAVLEPLIARFNSAVAPHVGGARSERAPRHVDGPQDLQL